MAEKQNGEKQEKQLTVQRDIFGFSDMREEMDRLWEAVTGRARIFPQMRIQTIPAIDVFEKDEALHVRAELPGLTDKDVEINVSEDGLTISGEKKEEKEVKEEKYYRSERSYGKFVRRLPLPKAADTDKAQAKFRDGILEINIPLKAEAPQKKIAIKS